MFVAVQQYTSSMENSLQYVTIHKLRSILSDSGTISLGDDFLVTEISISEKFGVFNYPFRVDAFMAVFCLSANVCVDINLNRYEVQDKSLLIVSPGNMVSFCGPTGESGDKGIESLHLVLLAVSPEFMSNIHFDFARLFKESLAILNHPYIMLTDEELSVSSRYLELIRQIAGMSVGNKREVISNLMTSVFYLMASLWSERLAIARNKGGKPQTVRANMVFEQFIKLVTNYHDSERGMAFYADKLCLTPKYLSKLIKQVSGRSGPDWIDAFVILEAKNLLKYSGSTIKEIVYKLHFPNQSVFYKFFKAHTGMTPSEYRKA